MIPAIDAKDPASCSRKVTKNYLREKLKFNGLVVTDALDMGALGGPRRIHISALRALTAGADLLCFSGLYDQSLFVESSLETIRNAVRSGDLEASSIETNAERIRRWQAPKPHGSSMKDMPNSQRYESGVHVQGNVFHHRLPIERKAEA